MWWRVRKLVMYNDVFLCFSRGLGFVLFFLIST